MKYLFIISILITSELFSESWKFISREELLDKNSSVTKCEIVGDQIFLENRKSRANEISITNGGNTVDLNIPKPERARIYDIFNYKNEIYVSAEFGLYKYKSGDWNHFKIKDRFENFRHSFKSIEHNGKIYSLSHARLYSSLDSTNDIHRSFVDTNFTELHVLNNDSIEIKFQLKDEFYYNFFIDSHGTFWFVGNADSSGGLIKYENGNFEKIDINQYISDPKRAIFTHITGDENYLYISNDYVVSPQTQNFPAQLIRYNKANMEIDVFDFPESEDLMAMKQVQKMEIINGELFIGTDNGLFKLENEQIVNIDIFSGFLDNVSEIQKQFLAATDFDYDNGKFYIATSIGLIFTDDFTSNINLDGDQSKKINVYPNVLSGNSNITLDPMSNSYNILDIQLFKIDGTFIKSFKNNYKRISEKRQINLSIINSGHYYLIISTDSGDFVAPLIVEN
jgi:ligand-binding sensor domain-containing protein